MKGKEQEYGYEHLCEYGRLLVGGRMYVCFYMTKGDSKSKEKE